MQEFEAYLNGIADPAHRARLEGILQEIQTAFPQLTRAVKWNQPMFLDHGTFILAFSVAKEHIAVAPEGEVVEHFRPELAAAGYNATAKFFRIRWKDKVDTELLHRIVQYNIDTKKDTQSFWRPQSEACRK